MSASNEPRSLPLVELLRGCRFTGYADEERLQRGIASVLDQTEIAYEREARIDARSRLDFLVDGVGIEVKVEGAASSVLRQLRRYARHEAVQELILVTSRTKHLRVPKEIEGKPVFVVWLGIHGL